MPVPHAAVDAVVSPRCPPDVCVAAVLGDTLHRVAVLGGREGVPRSLGSVYGGSVTRFLGGMRGVVSRVIATPGIAPECNGVAVSRDGSTLLVTDWRGGSHALHVFSVVDGSLCRVVGCRGRGPLEFSGPFQVYVAPDDFVFVAEHGNKRVQVLTPTLDFHAFIGVRRLACPAGVCANADVVVVSEHDKHRIFVFNRADGAVLRRFGSHGGGDGQLSFPKGLCFVAGSRHVAVADAWNNRVSVFSVDTGDFIRHVGAGVVQYPKGVACSAHDELVVADATNKRVVVFDSSGEMVRAMACRDVVGVAMPVSGDAVFAQASVECIVLS